MLRIGSARTLLLLGLASANLLVLTLSGYSLYQSREHYERRAENLTQNIANALDQNLSASIGRLDLALRATTDELERQLATRGIDAPALDAFLEKYQRRLPEVEAFRVADEAGRVFAGKGVDRSEPASWADREYFRYLRDHAEGGLQISKPRMGRVAKQPIIGFARRYNRPDGSFGGVVSAPIAVAHLESLLGQFDLGRRGTLILRDADLGLITRVPAIPDQPAGQIGNAGVSREFRDLVASGVPSATYHLSNSPDGFERILTFRRLEAAPMIAIVGVASEDYLGDWYREAYKTAGLGLGFLLLSVLTGRTLLRMLAEADLRERALTRSIEAGRLQREKLQASQQLLDSIVENIPSMIFVKRAKDLSFELFNRAGEELLGIERERLIGRSDHDFFPAGQADSFVAKDRAVLQQNGMVDIAEEPIETPRGTRILHTRKVALRDQGGRPLFLLGISDDITERKEHELQLARAKEAAEAASLAKSRFLATMSHEIRTPMNGILGMAQLLLMPGLSEDERCEYAQVIMSSGQTLLSLLNDILDLAKIEAGRVEMKAEAVDAGQLLGEIATLFGRQAREKGLDIESAWHGRPAAAYLADPVRLRQMLSNLASNAVKFTARGSIRIDGSEVEAAGERALLRFAVTDTGIGIPADKQATLFMPFSQVDASNTRGYGGTGLGLSIVRHLAGLMGGEVGLESEEGKGTRVWFTVRVGLAAGAGPGLHEPAPAGAAAAARPPADGAYVLVVEDNDTNRRVIETMLAKRGIRSASVRDGLEAVRHVTAGNTPAMLLMDIQMPVMDGLEAARRIRDWEREGGRPRVPIVALTASAFEEDRGHCLEAGMDDFLAKPIDWRELEARLGKWLQAASAGQA